MGSQGSGKSSRKKRAKTREATESEEKYRTIVENSSDFIFMIDAEDRVLSLNRAAAMVFRKSPEEAIGKSIFNLFPNEIATEFSRSLKRVFETGEGQISESKMAAEGKEWWISTNLNPVRSNEGKVVAVMGVTRDITQRKQMEDSLRASEEKYSSLVEKGNDGIIIIQDDKLVFVNQKIIEITGFSPEEAIGKPFTEFVSPEYRESVLETYKRRLKGEAVPSRYEMEIIAKSGNKIPVEINASIIEYEGRTADMAIIRDITERKKTEEAIYKVNRALRIVTASNQALVHAEEEMDLLNDICRTIVQVGGYRMAWIGFAEQDKEKTVRPVAKWGYDAGYLDSVRFTWADTEPGRGPTGKVIRTGKPRVVNNISTEPDYPPRVEAIKRGYASQVTLPFIAHEKAFGVLNIYAADPNAFNEEEVNLLMELAKDLSYGIMALRLRDEHKKAEEQIKQIQEYLQLQVNRMPIGLIVWDTEFRVKTWNPSAARIFGFSENEALGKHPYDLIVPKQAQPHVDTIWGRLLKGDKTAHSVNENLTKDGRTIICEWTNTPLKREDGTVMGVLSMVQDITERKRLEEAKLRAEAEAAEARMARETIESMMDAVIINDLEGRIVQFNRAFTETFGWGEEAVGKLPTELVAERDIPRVAEAVKECFEKGYLKNFESTIVTKDKKDVPVLVSATLKRDSEGNPTGLITVIKDITERKRMEEDFSHVFNLSFDMLCIAGVDGYFKRLNPAWEKTLGYTGEELLAKPFLEFVHPEDRAATVAEVQKLSTGIPTIHFDNRYRCKDGSYKWLEWNTMPVAAEGLLYAVAHDVTEDRRLEEDRLRLQESKSRFVSASAHELKTPLAAIKGYADLLTRGTLGETSPPVKDGLTVILRNTNRMLGLIGELLDIQRMDNGMVKLNIETVDLAGVVKESIEDLTPIMNSKKLQLELKLPHVLKVSGDGIRLHEVVENLLSNAIKFTPENGKIRITVAEETDQLRVTVSDTGIGISAYYLPHIFDPFAKIPKARLTGDYGTFAVYETGLGLNVTKRLIEMHGGKIWAESEGEGKGSTFTFTIPKEMKKFEK